jgi:tetratricopeptide (TPR) repeat protein
LVELPSLTLLIPALLDRGDPLGREFVARFAMFDDRPQLMEALSRFAFGMRGPDKLRFEVLSFLKKSHVVDAGPHRFYSKGQWSNVLILGAEITTGTELLNYPEQVRELLEEGSKAQHAGDFDRAEAIYKSVLAEDPNNCTAIYNSCVIWLNRDGEQGRANAFARLTKLHSQSPSYLLAPIALAQLAADDGDLKTAHDLLTSAYNESKLSYSEAVALFTAQIQIAILEKKLDAAQLAFEALLNFAEPGDRRIDLLRRRIDSATSKNPLRRLISSSFSRLGR